MKKLLWETSIAAGLTTSITVGTIATVLCAVYCFINYETAFDIVSGVGWSICFFCQVCALIELFQRKKSVSE